ncbi:MAG: hypothetical protein AAFN07_12840 [Pseudomonadota bacterium]
MQVNLKIVDETTSGQVYNETVLQLASRRVCARDVIEQRVRQEVQKFNDAKKKDLFSGLVQPRDTEKELNGYRFKKEKTVNADEQVEIALSAFSENRFFFLLDDKQVESLDDEFGITDSTKITFLKLIPVVGG